MRQEREVEEGIEAGVESRDSPMMLRVVWGERDQRLDMDGLHILASATDCVGEAKSFDWTVICL